MPQNVLMWTESYIANAHIRWHFWKEVAELRKLTQGD
jgi:hypothetical protein